MDDVDAQIIEALMHDARTPLAALAKELGLATATVHNRVKRLRERGIIAGSRVVLDWDQIGYPVVATISIALSTTGSIEDAADRLATIPFVQNCFAITGEFDLLIVVRARSSQHLGELLDDIRRLVPGQSRTVVVLRTYFADRLPPLSAPG
jgi:Lrp/AsnC family transcriptional regulator for asnA, asnC and gidA